MRLLLPGIVLASSGVASGFDFSVRSAAVDQPRINFAVARAATPNTPLTGNDIFGGETIFAQGFFDTGASGVVVSENIANELGIQRQTVNGETVVFGDASPSGIVPFNVGEPLQLRIGDNWGAVDGGLTGDPQRVADLSNPANFITLYDESFGPIRPQIGPIGAGGNPITGDLNVIGMPAMQNKVVVMDARPTNNFATLLDDDDSNDNFDVQMRTFVYDPGTPFNGQASTFAPGIPTPDVTVALSYGDFSRFTTLEPSQAAGAIPATLNDNPFLGPSPVSGPGDTTPAVQMCHNGLKGEGSFLLDTGAATSFISTDLASQVGVSYDPANPLGSSNPRLLGVDLEDQFTLQISGISGEVLTVPGFYADNMLVRTEQGDAANDQDPNHLNWRGSPVLVFDIEIFDEAANETIMLDGICGVNHLVATADILPTDFIPLFLNPTATPFDYVTFDEPAGTLGLNFAPGQARPPADANRDGTVDLADFGILRANFGASGVGHENGDFNCDGVVDLADFGILRANFGGTAADAQLLDAWAISIPEPSVAGLLVAAPLLRRRRH